jgi:hypothetical protein
VAARITSIEKSSDLIRNQTRYLPACSIVPQTTTLMRASLHKTATFKSQIYIMELCTITLSVYVQFYNTLETRVKVMPRKSL